MIYVSTKMQVTGIVFGRSILFLSFFLSALLHPPPGGGSGNQKYAWAKILATHQNLSSGFAHPCVSVRLVCLLLARSLARTQFSSTGIFLFSPVHVHPPSRVRETRVVAVTVAAAADIVIVLL